MSRAESLPFEVGDAARKEEDLQREDAQFVTVTQDTRLESRWVDLRTPANQAIFSIQSAVCQVRTIYIAALPADMHPVQQLPWQLHLKSSIMRKCF